jgi:thioredoxin family protein
MAKPKVMIFGKADCAKCKTTKNKVGHYINRWGLDAEVPIVFMDMDTIEGLSEGAFRDVWEVPTTIVEQPNGSVARWDGEVPKSEALRASLTA